MVSLKKNPYKSPKIRMSGNTACQAAAIGHLSVHFQNSWNQSPHTLHLAPAPEGSTTKPTGKHITVTCQSTSACESNSAFCQLISLYHNEIRLVRRLPLATYQFTSRTPGISLSTLCIWHQHQKELPQNRPASI